MVDEQTITVYDSRTEDYFKMTQGQPGRHLQHLIKTLGAGANVLDIGCGPATSSVHMRAAGLIPDPIDASVEMVALANRTHNIGARHASFDSLHAKQIYDGIWANFSLLHAKKVDFTKHLAAIHQALKPAGLFIIGMKLGTGTERDVLGRLYSYYTVEELFDLLKAAGFKINEQYFGEEAGLAGTIDPWIIVYCIKTAS